MVNSFRLKMITYLSLYSKACYWMNNWMMEGWRNELIGLGISGAIMRYRETKVGKSLGRDHGRVWTELGCHGEFGRAEI